MSKETNKKGTKKPYQKPEIVYEDFSLSTNIAAGCEFQANYAENQCGYKVAGDRFDKIVFINASTGCTDYQSSDAVYDGFCYHNPTEENNLFNS